ncbi:MAG: O-antigen ligase family protein [Bacteroidota bacterium]
MLVFFLLHLIGLFYSQNKNEGWEHIMLKLPFVFMPLVLFLSADFLREKNNKILLSFVAGNFLASVICLTTAIVRSFTFVNGSWVFNAELMEHYGYSFWQMLANGGNNFMYDALSIFIHPGYFSMFIVVSVLIIIDLLLHREIGKSVIARILYILLLPFFFIMVYLLFARTGMIALFIVLLGYLISITFSGRGKLYKAGILIVFLVAAITIMSNNGRMKNTYNVVNKLLTNPDQITKQDDRIYIWGISLEIIKNNFFTGVGTGDSKDNLMVVYKKEQMEEAQKAKLNVHNQYLETMMQLGLLGLLVLLVVFIWPFIYALKNRNILLMLFVLVNVVFFLFECVLNTQAGVFYFTFVLSLLMFVRPMKKTSVFPLLQNFAGKAQ